MLLVVLHTRLLCVLGGIFQILRLTFIFLLNECYNCNTHCKNELSSEDTQNWNK